MSTAPKDTSAAFFHDFNTQVTSLQSQIDSLALPPSIAEANVNPVLTTSTRSTTIDSCLAGIAALAHRVQDAGDWLPGYDQRMYAQTIKTLSLRLETTRAAVAPKAKFVFKSARKRAPQPSSIAPREVLDAEDGSGSGSKRAPDNVGERETAIKAPKVEDVQDGLGTDADFERELESYEDAKGGTLMLDLSNPAAALPTRLKNVYIRGIPSSTSMSTPYAPNPPHPTAPPPQPTTLTLTHLSHSILNLVSFTCFISRYTPPLHPTPIPPTPSLTSLTLTHLTSCLLLAPPISGPLHLTHLRSCVLYIPQARQVRMHDCVGVDVYLCVGSRPVVERCRGIRVAPAPPEVLADELELKVKRATASSSSSSTPTATPNLWNQVDDFDWLRSEQSPHWSEIPAEERVTRERWSDFVPRGAGGGWLEGQVVFGNNGGRFKTDVEELLRIVGMKIPRTGEWLEDPETTGAA